MQHPADNNATQVADQDRRIEEEAQPSPEDSSQPAAERIMSVFHEDSDEDVALSKGWHVRQALAYATLLVIIYPSLFYSKAYSVEMNSLHDEFFEVWQYTCWTLELYGVQVVFHTIMAICLNKKNFYCQRFFSPIIFLMQTFVTLYGAHYSWSRKMEDLVYGDPL